MPSRVALLASLLVLVLAVGTAPAWAQSAGDEQYDDPFAGQEDQGGGGSQPAPASTPSPPAAAPAAAPTAAPPASAPTASTTQLPRTGADALLTALLGLGLVMAGVGLRLRVPADGG